MDSFPEGGLRAWLTICGGWCSLFISFGFCNAFGVFQNYYKTHTLSDYSDSEISWIGSMQVCVMFGSGLIVGQLFDAFGPTYLLIAGGLCSVVSMMLLSISTTYWAVFLTLGLLTGIGASLMFYPSTSIVNHYFHKRRGLAAGMTVSGSSIGGVIYPILLTQLISKTDVGFGWAVRITGFLMLGLAIIAVALERPRLPRKPLHSFIDKSALRDGPFLVFAASVMFMMWGLFIAFFYIAPYGVYKGTSEYMSNYYVSILNAGSVFGRLLPGYIADKVGKWKVYFAATASSAILTMAFWYNAHSSAAIIVFAALYGFCSGACISLMFPCLATLSPVHVIGTRGGMAFAGASVAALTGPPIAGAIINTRSSYHGAIGFSFACLAMAAILEALTPYLANRKREKESARQAEKVEGPSFSSDEAEKSLSESDGVNEMSGRNEVEEH